jgi:hypothetical protein
MPSLPGRLAACGIALCLAACAAKLPVGVSFDPLESFPAEASWNWNATANVLPKDDRIEALQLDPVLREAIGAELAAHGYRLEASGNPDYLVSYELGLTTRVRPETSLSVASLSLLIRDFETRRRVWMAFVQTEIDISRSAAERRANIRKVVAEMLESFPPRREG